MVEPFLKWAGGKRWLTAAGLLPVPHSYKRLVEPFLGGGAVYFYLRPMKALLSDINEDLIHLYFELKKRPGDLYDLMLAHHKKHSKKYYYKMRDHTPSNDLERAARFLYLNRTCWNGLYRVNLQGTFNVPIGTKKSVVFDGEDFDAISAALQAATLRCSDFEPIIDGCQEGDFLFVDPPYTALHNYNGFLKYNEKIFSWNDQVRLRNALLRAKDRRVSIVVTNAHHESIHALYGGLGKYQLVERHSVLAGDRTKRGRATEVVYFANLNCSLEAPERGCEIERKTESQRTRF